MMSGRLALSIWSSEISAASTSKNRGRVALSQSKRTYNRGLSLPRKQYNKERGSLVEAVCTRMLMPKASLAVPN